MNWYPRTEGHLGGVTVKLTLCHETKGVAVLLNAVLLSKSSL